MGRTRHGLAVVLLLAACSPSVPPATAAAFNQDEGVQHTAACAHAALISGEMAAWDAALAALRTQHQRALPSIDFGNRESQIMQAVLDAKARLFEQGVADQASAREWYRSNCA